MERTVSRFPFLAEHQRILDILSMRDGEGRFVGSAVRDSLCGRTIKDFDIATTHVPQVVKEICAPFARKILDIGIAHGTVTVFLDKARYEITTLRKDVETDGRHARVSFTDDWQCDAARRDFTFNALYVDQEGRLYDYFGGQEDLQAGCVRFIGDPDVRIQEDYLRILRFFRFVARYGKGDMHALSLEACFRHKAGLKSLSRERVASELFAMFDARPVVLENVLPVMCEAGILRPWHTGKGPLTLSKWQALHALQLSTGLPVSGLVHLKSLFGMSCPTFLLARKEQAFWKELDTPFVDFNADTLLRAWRVMLSEASYEAVWGCFWLSLAERITSGALEQTQALSWLKLIDKKGDRIPPMFPLTGKDIKKLGVKEGPALGQILDHARGLWKKSGCSLAKEPLLIQTHEIIIDKKNT